MSQFTLTPALSKVTDKAFIEVDLKVWAAGVETSDWVKDLGLEVNRINQLEAKGTLQSVSDDDVYAIGDCCSIAMEDGKPVPPRAQSAHLAGNIVARLKGKPQKDFKYKDYDSLINLSCLSTVGNLMEDSLFIEGLIARTMYFA